jgi:hypothetical protein
MYGGIDVGEVHRVQKLAAENRKLKEVLAEGELGNHALKAANRKAPERPYDRGEAVASMIARGTSERRACRRPKSDRMALHYKPKRKPPMLGSENDCAAPAKERRRY